MAKGFSRDEADEEERRKTNGPDNPFFGAVAANLDAARNYHQGKCQCCKRDGDSAGNLDLGGFAKRVSAFAEAISWARIKRKGKWS